MIVAISRGVQTALLEGGVPAERIRCIPSGVDTARFAPTLAARNRVRSRYNIAPHLPVVLSVGALVARKGHSTLLVAAQQLKEQGYDIRYLICGDGALRSDLEAQAQILGLAQEVRFTGFCSEVPELQAAADCFVHVPRYEGLGVAVIEALAAGLPTIASRVGGIPELIEDEKTGILIPPTDANALSAALVRLFSHKQFARQLGIAGQTFVRNHFDINVMARTNEALYLELLADTS
jgi:glycosyltransferase involved in cell wall biosynthesis